MTTFEFVTVLLSIVVGLGLTRLLSGIGRALELARTLRFYWVQGVWVLNIALALVVFWWATLYGHVEAEVWAFSNFSLLLLYSVLLYLQAVVIVPADLTKSTDLEAHFFLMRPWFFSLGMLVPMAELGDTYLHGGLERIWGFGPFYVLLSVSGIIMSAIALRTTNRRFHGAWCVLYFLGLSSWILARFSAIG
ncbi:MAG: hypothetical protein HKO65_20650 [Gemmatimonadetes bacterium]|nr:hypothetical protein [Gemmatimonadota bacterium]NNM07513.1 hypothetical protein [Gemmatimonadota bacterium]